MKKYLLLFLIILFANQFSNAQVAVIAHKSVSVEKITDAKLLDFYTGDIRLWSDDSPVIVFDLKPKGEVKDMFYDFLGKSPSRMKSIWLKKMLSGEGDPPKSLLSEEDMLKNVSSTPGSVGFISNSKVTDRVKVLAIIQK